VKRLSFFLVDFARRAPTKTAAIQCIVLQNFREAFSEVPISPQTPNKSFGGLSNK